MKILVTGSAGFIGFHLVKNLLPNYEVVGIDNINDYYDVNLKYARLHECGISKKDIQWNTAIKSTIFDNYTFYKINLEDKEALLNICAKENFDVIINLAAQAGVRYSINNPDIYVQSNIVGFLNILEAARHYKIKHLVYASSSSVYGLNTIMPFSVQQGTDHPVSLYAATKKANELMAHTYSHLYNLPTTGLRFFTVYGEWGRPDMAYYIFADAITKGKPIKVYNHGKMQRDFTYVDDIVNGIINVINKPPVQDRDWDAGSSNPAISSAPFKIYNIGNNKPVPLIDFIKVIEANIGKNAVLEFTEMQDGDVTSTWADINELKNLTGYEPATSINEGIKKFIDWYKVYPAKH